jgi:hypothetical protein
VDVALVGVLMSSSQGIRDERISGDAGLRYCGIAFCPAFPIDPNSQFEILSDWS